VSWLALALAPATLQAAAPSFDCAKADGEVETLICKDAALAALDQRLTQTYEAASARAGASPSTTWRGWA
jgi:uncharacterized protein